MSKVEIRDLRKTYDGLEVIHGIDIDIADGEFVSLVGPSGCGKSTLLRMIAGLEEVASGQIIIGDRVINDVAPKDRDIAMVFQNYALYPHMTVRQNLGFALKQRRLPRDEINERVNGAAGILGLAEYLDRKPRALSGGQRQRVAMGRAIVRNPTVFLFDEPLSNLDAKLRVLMRSELKELHQRLSTTTVYVTHDQIEAMTLSDKIVVMNGGHIEQVGTPLDLYDNPKSLFVAAFIGSPQMNFLEGVMTDNGSLRLPDLSELPLGRQIATAGAEVTVGLRPEHLFLTESGWPAEAVVIEPTGSETQITARASGKTFRILVRGRTEVKPGQSITLGFDPQHLHVFSTAIGKRAS
ncbi:ABC transporter ATP-binding protein [Pseudorhodobacter sp.]|uniref:ABC transporter ATP-binding protein n=1 Tax=Pseudorhodobacter sp. TaxID=1934400 RepID=UPI00264754EA|nr:sn-glycerol-3-phosphate ABC transporter ATP-binding protein UgpC [Pseudorhodobacter sp.]MDN5788125.1 sn-glycerol-3-phosphate ABC transporter ATP-binding protein UgpC [Pseudorhodobacter sp.]